METTLTRGEKKVYEYEQEDFRTEGENVHCVDVSSIVPKVKYAVAEEEVVQRRVITRDEAMREVADLFRQRKELSYSEIMSELGLDLETTIEICTELEKKGKIKAIT